MRGTKKDSPRSGRSQKRQNMKQVMDLRSKVALKRKVGDLERPGNALVDEGRSRACRPDDENRDPRRRAARRNVPSLQSRQQAREHAMPVSNSPPLASSRSPPLSLLYQSFRRESTGRARRPTGLRTPLGPTRD